MGKPVGRWLKRGKRKVYSQSYATKAGAERAARVAARKAGKSYKAGEPFRWGDHWLVYIHKK